MVLTESRLLARKVRVFLRTMTVLGVALVPILGHAGVSRCPGDAPWSDSVVAAAVGISEYRLENVKRARALDNATLCSMAEAALQRAIFRAENPKPDNPDGWAKFRSQQQSDENGVVNPEGLLNALQARRGMLEQQALRTSSGVSAAGAGLTSAQWTAIGPGNVGGRVRSIVIHPTTPSTMWAGSVAGGIWKTVDAGASWTAVNDFMPNLAISSMLISPADPNVMYAGTGEGFFNGDAVRGAGVFKSVDGGVTWNQLPSTNPATAGAQWYYVNRLAVHPANANILLAATNNGLYRSADAGANWTLQTSGTLRVADVKFDPSNGNKAVFGQGYGGGPVSYSNDGGVTWTSSSLNPSGRVELAYARNLGAVGIQVVTSSVLYASVDYASGSVYRSTDGGATWSLQSSPGHLGSQGWYDNAIWVDPVDSNHVIVGGIDLHRSTNGGLNFSRISRWDLVDSGSVHADHHVIVASPLYNGTSNRTIFFGNDGGVYKAQDIAAVTSVTTGWTMLNNGLAITQFYGGAGHNGTNGRIIGGTQDNGSLVYTGSGTSWTKSFGGDGGFSAVDPTDGNYNYGEYVRLTLHRSTTGGAASFIYQGITEAGSSANFIAPFALDPNNPNTMLAGGASLWRSTNVKAAAPSWAYILASTGSYISQIAIAQGNSNLVWVGKNNGKLFKSINGTAAPFPTFAQMGAAYLPAGRMVLSILIDKDSPNTVYAGFGGYSSNNLWRTTDGGISWTSIGGSLPPSPIRSIQRHPANASYLYVGTEVGVFTSEDGGATWATTNDGPANVSVDQLFWFDPKTLVAVTHGRGMFKAAIPTYTLTVRKTGSGRGTVTSSPAGINCGATCAYTFGGGMSVTLTATPATNSNFIKWRGLSGCDTRRSCVVRMDTAKYVEAIFTDGAYNFSFPR